MQFGRTPSGIPPQHLISQRMPSPAFGEVSGAIFPDFGRCRSVVYLVRAGPKKLPLVVVVLRVVQPAGRKLYGSSLGWSKICTERCIDGKDRVRSD